MTYFDAVNSIETSLQVHRVFGFKISCWPAPILQAKFVITDFDRETVVDDAVYQSLRSGEYWTRNPKANRLFLVLDDISSP